jgi:hypothetical protein
MFVSAEYFTGLDLGQTQDFTALAVAERTTVSDPAREGQTVFHFAIRHLHRWPLGTSYPQVVADVKALFAAPPLTGTVLAIDRTGVGRAVVDQFVSAGISASLRPLTSTGGEKSGGGSVAKKDLVGAVQVPLQNRRLRIAEGLPLASVLAEELAAFRVKITLAGNETFEAWRERDHDDLVLAVAMALYLGSFPTTLVSIVELPSVRRPRPRLWGGWSG